MRVIGLAGLLGGAVLIVGVACKSTPSGNGNGCASTGASVTIDARDNQTFSNPSATINLGQKVCWQNTGTIGHTVTADATVADTTWKLNSSLTPDQVVQYTFNKTGVDYHYHCTVHSGMIGVISVR